MYPNSMVEILDWMKAHNPQKKWEAKANLERTRTYTHTHHISTIDHNIHTHTHTHTHRMWLAFPPRDLCSPVDLHVDLLQHLLPGVFAEVGEPAV